MSRTDQLLHRNLLLCVTSAALLTAAACAPGDDVDAAEDELQPSAPLALQTQAKNPSGSYFAEVKANGTGCPPGSWQTDISPDGQTFSTTFDEFEISVSSSKSIAVKDCTLRITLHSPQGLSFAVQSFQYSGYALLGKDVKARHVATYYFQGNADAGGEAITDLVGPKDQTYRFDDDLDSASLVWSECGEQRNLNVRSTLRLQNADKPVDGYINLAAVDARTKLTFKLAWKTCKPAADAKKDDAKAETKKEDTKTETKKEDTKTETKPATKPSSSDSIWDAIGAALGGGGPVVIGTTRR